MHLFVVLNHVSVPICANALYLMDQ
jgi:hypothetical protein